MSNDPKSNIIVPMLSLIGPMLLDPDGFASARGNAEFKVTRRKPEKTPEEKEARRRRKLRKKLSKRRRHK